MSAVPTTMPDGVLHMGHVLDVLCGMPSESVQGWRVQRYVSPGHALRVLGSRGGWLGRRHSEETRQRLSEIARARSKLETKAAGRAQAGRLFGAEPCLICGLKAERHHIDGEPRNNNPLNVVFLCRPHHRQIHPGNGSWPLRPLSELRGR